MLWDFFSDINSMVKSNKIMISWENSTSGAKNNVKLVLCLEVMSCVRDIVANIFIIVYLYKVSKLEGCTYALFSTCFALLTFFYFQYARGLNIDSEDNLVKNILNHIFIDVLPLPALSLTSTKNTCFVVVTACITVNIKHSSRRNM